MTNFDLTAQQVRSAVSAICDRADNGQVADSDDIKWYLEEMDLTEAVADEAYLILVDKLCH